jgi:DNA ligase-1
MDAVSIINRLAATTSRNEKEQILIDAFMQGHRDFFVGAQLAYDILVSFGVKKVAEIVDMSDDPGTYTFDDFKQLADDLRKRKLTGHAARDAIHAAAERCHIPTWNTFYRRILLKDFKCGVDTSTINKVLNKLGSAEPEALDYLIPVFSCQLAHDGAKPENAKHLKGEKLLDIKLDGVRLITILDKENGTVTQYARNGAINENFVEIREGLERLLATLPGSIVLDGEIVAGSFQDLMKQFGRSKGKADTSAARLALFDVLPLADFQKGYCPIPQITRHAILSEMQEKGDFQKHTNGLVYVIPKVHADLSAADQTPFHEFNKQAIAAGYEGIMVKDPNAPYELKRSRAWLKIKPFIEVSLEIVGYEEGKPDSKYVGMLGAWIMEGVDDGRKIRVNVGGGLSDEERKTYWAKRDQMIGYIGEVRADAMTLEQDGDVWSLRFPRWKGLRGTKPGEKL